MALIKDLLESGNVTISVSLSDLNDFAKSLVETSKQELEKQITEANTETYLTTDQTSKMLNVDRSTLWRWHKKKYLCHIEVGGMRKYRKSDINTILNGGK